jgi:hypothetical protein
MPEGFLREEPISLAQKCSNIRLAAPCVQKHTRFENIRHDACILLVS